MEVVEGSVKESANYCVVELVPLHLTESRTGRGVSHSVQEQVQSMRKAVAVSGILLLVSG